MRVQISIDDNLLEKIDEYAKKNYLSRSGFISMASVQYLNQLEVADAMHQLNFLLEKLVLEGKADDETKKQMLALQSVVDAIKK